MLNPLIEQFKRDVKEFDETIAPLTESTANIKAFIYDFTLNLITKMIEELKGREKEQLDKSNPDNYEACYAIAGFNDALSSTISQLVEFREYLLEELEK